MNTPLTPEQFAALARLDAPTLANTIETFQQRLRNEGFVDHTVRCLFPHLPPMLGYAATIKIRGSAPPTASSDYPDRTDLWDYIMALPKPRVIVVQDMATRPGLGALVGAVHMHILKMLDCVGVVTNGSVRDLPAADQAGFHLFAGSLSVSRAYLHSVEIGRPVQIGGLKIRSGDLLHGDLHGVQSIPLPIAALIPEAAANVRAREQVLIDLCQSPHFSLVELRKAMVGQNL